MSIVIARPPAIKAGWGPRAPRPRRRPTDPRDSWPTWTGTVRVAPVDIAVELDAPDDGPTVPDDPFRPGPADLAEDLGFLLGRSGSPARFEDARRAVRAAFALGWRRGSREFHRSVDARAMANDPTDADVDPHGVC